jgi:hypothetical protein
MGAGNPSGPLCQRAVRIGLSGEGKRVKQNQTEMIQWRRGCPQSVKLSRRSCCLATGMGLRHTRVPTLLRHLLTAVPLGWCHRSARHRTCHHGQRGEQYRQSENSDFTRECQRHQCSCNCRLDATSEGKASITAVTGANFYRCPACERPARVLRACSESTAFSSTDCFR